MSKAQQRAYEIAIQYVKSGQSVQHNMKLKDTPQVSVALDMIIARLQRELDDLIARDNAETPSK